MILSAGYGTRLWPLTEDRTKPAIPILGKPLVGYVAEYLAKFGCTEIVVNLHHRPDSVRAALGDGRQFGVSLTYIEEPVILGTSGALDNARELLSKETFVVVNGKIITDIDLNAALEEHCGSGALATLVLLPNRKREQFSIVEVSGGLVKGFGGMPEPRSNEASVPLMFTGIQILDPRIFDYIPRGVFSHSTTDVYPRAIAQGQRIVAHVASGTWYELSTIHRYLEISLALLQQKSSQFYAGKGSVIGEKAIVDKSIIWDGAIVEDRASISRSVIGDGVRIKRNQHIEDAVIVRADVVRGKAPPAKALHGTFEGDNFVVPLSQ